MHRTAIEDLFAPLGPVSVRPMFGGHGIYRAGVIFALEAGGEIFLKADGTSEPLFRAAASTPFTYRKKTGVQATLSYWRLPHEALDDDEALVRWCRLALEAADRSR